MAVNSHRRRVRCFNDFKSVDLKEVPAAVRFYVEKTDFEKLKNHKHHSLSTNYLIALRTYLTRKSAEVDLEAQSLGRAALAEGLVTLDLAIMHERALSILAPSLDLLDTVSEPIKRAGVFFKHAIIPLEADQRTIRETNQHLKQRNEMLRLHSSELAKANSRLEKEVVRRKSSELSVLSGKEKYRKLFLESEIMQQKLRQLTRQIISAQEEERKEISRELHDEVVQTLVGINVELAALGKSASSGLHVLKAKITRTQRLVENSVNAVHRFARELRPAVLDDLGLIPALHAYSTSLSSRKKLKIQLTVFRGIETLNNTSCTVLFRVAQEALTNVVRHARASHVKIIISESIDIVRMEICDNGKSFQVEKTLHAKNQKRLGLVGMNERVEMLGGNLTIMSSPGKGTTVRAEVPFQKNIGSK